jgi:hypothetical protein
MRQLSPRQTTGTPSCTAALNSTAAGIAAAEAAGQAIMITAGHNGGRFKQVPPSEVASPSVPDVRSVETAHRHYKDSDNGIIHSTTGRCALIITC